MWFKSICMYTISGEVKDQVSQEWWMNDQSNTIVVRPGRIDRHNISGFDSGAQRIVMGQVWETLSQVLLIKVRSHTKEYSHLHLLHESNQSFQGRIICAILCGRSAWYTVLLSQGTREEAIWTLQVWLAVQQEAASFWAWIERMGLLELMKRPQGLGKRALLVVNILISANVKASQDIALNGRTIATFQNFKPV